MSASAFEQYLATEEARRAAQISLVAAVAGSYLSLAADGENLRLAQVTLEAQQASYELIRATGTPASPPTSTSAGAEPGGGGAGERRAFTGAVAVGRNALQLLVGTPLSPDSSGVVRHRHGPRGVSAGLSSDVLLCRPDILAAEHRLRAANANIGAARAAFFHEFPLRRATAPRVPSSPTSSRRGRGPGPSCRRSSPLFASGSLLANLKASKVDREIASRCTRRRSRPPSPRSATP